MRRPNLELTVPNVHATIGEGIDTTFFFRKGVLEPNFPALVHLSQIDGSRFEDATLGHPFSVYFKSLSGVIKNLRDLTSTLRAVKWTEEDPTKFSLPSPGPTGQIVENLRLLIYAADTHVDDCRRIARALYTNRREFDGSPESKNFRDAAQLAHEDISVLCNYLKHNQAILSLFEQCFILPGFIEILLGYILWGRERGKLVPYTRPLHSQSDVSSLISLIFIFLIRTRMLSEGISGIAASHEFGVPTHESSESHGTSFNQFLHDLLHLPVYAIDDNWILEKHSVTVDGSFAQDERAAFGSYFVPWATAKRGALGSGAAPMEIDARTNTIVFPMVKSVSLIRWRNPTRKPS
jgi:hypothetical protein